MPENEATLRTGETPVERLLKRLIHCESGFDSPMKVQERQ